MRSLELDLDGVIIAPHFQQYASASAPGIPCGELLARPTGHDGIEAFFSGLNCEQCLRVLEWQLELKEMFTRVTGCTMSINVVNSVVTTPEQREAFLVMVDRYPTPTVFEFTETHPMPPVDVANHFLRELRERGHQTALDDFGTGLNGMSLLTDYDFDIVKVDRALTFDVANRVEKQKTLALIQQMLAVLGKRHVIEGVEDQVVFDLLCAAGFTTFQAFLFHRPAPLADVMTRLVQAEVA